MNLFNLNKKLNIEKDRLIRKFDYKNREYYYIILESGIEKRIDESKLDNKSKKKLLLENKQLLLNNDLYKKEVKDYKKIQRSKYLKSIGFGNFGFEVFGNVNCDNMSKSMKDFLDDLLSRDDILVGISRVGTFMNQDKLDDIFTNGLLITGHLSGAYSTKKTLSDNVSYYPDNEIIRKELMYADSYKNSVGSILVVIKDEDLEKNSDILIEEDCNTRLNPKYIMGYVPLYENNYIDHIVFNENYNKENIKNNLGVCK